MKATQYKSNEKHEFLIFECDWKENLPRKEINQANEHINKVNGEFIELHVWMCDAKIFYAGPAGIEAWIAKQPKNDSCAFHIFQDYAQAGECDSTIFAEVIKWFFDGEKVYVEVHFLDNEVRVMEYSEWTRMADNMNADL